MITDHATIKFLTRQPSAFGSVGGYLGCSYPLPRRHQLLRQPNIYILLDLRDQQAMKFSRCHNGGYYSLADYSLSLYSDLSTRTIF
jgi:hypothetical protein